MPDFAGTLVFMRCCRWRNKWQSSLISAIGILQLCYPSIISDNWRSGTESPFKRTKEAVWVACLSIRGQHHRCWTHALSRLGWCWIRRLRSCFPRWGNGIASGMNVRLSARCRLPWCGIDWTVGTWLFSCDDEHELKAEQERSAKREQCPQWGNAVLVHAVEAYNDWCDKCEWTHDVRDDCCRFHDGFLSTNDDWHGAIVTTRLTICVEHDLLDEIKVFLAHDFLLESCCMGRLAP